MAANHDVNDFKMIVFFCTFILLLIIVRIYWVLIRRQGLKKKKVERLVKTMIVMGSGLINFALIYILGQSGQNSIITAQKSHNNAFLF